jgi:4-hydroxy-3-methylbut-2-enyl diphosphate reductase
MVRPSKSDICYATQNRQEAVKEVAREVDLLLVLGSQNSSNSNRLVDVARSCGTPSYLIHGVDDIDKSWLDDAQSIGLSSGASTPEILVQRVVEYLKSRGEAEISTLQVAREDVTFRLPPQLKALSPA